MSECLCVRLFSTGTGSFDAKTLASLSATEKQRQVKSLIILRQIWGIFPDFALVKIMTSFFFVYLYSYLLCRFLFLCLFVIFPHFFVLLPRKNVIYELINTEQSYMDDLKTTLEVSTLVRFYVLFTLLCFVLEVTVGLQPSSGKIVSCSLQAGFFRWNGARSKYSGLVTSFKTGNQAPEQDITLHCFLGHVRGDFLTINVVLLLLLFFIALLVLLKFLSNFVKYYWCGVESCLTSRQVFYNPLAQSGMLTEKELSTVFINWKELIWCNTGLLKYVSPGDLAT